jgi:hypothetical protein
MDEVDSKNIVDHKEQFDTLNNRKSNLRVTTNSKNNRSRRGLNKNNTSGYRNVSYNKIQKNWTVQLQDENYKNTIWRGFKSVHEAGEFAKNKRKEWYGKFAGKE